MRSAASSCRSSPPTPTWVLKPQGQGESGSFLAWFHLGVDCVYSLLRLRDISGIPFRLLRRDRTVLLKGIFYGKVVNA